MATVKLCLVMIVKNESSIIERMLNSIGSILDYICIEDTGSEDNTVEIIEKWGAEHHIPTTVHTNPFKNFGYNRTSSYRVAAETYPDSTHFILSDADFVWEVKPEFNKKILILPKYSVDQVSDNLINNNIRIISNKIKWECVGVTHEFWQEITDKDLPSARLKTLIIKDLHDGGCKSDKFERDERLLKAALEDPDEKDFTKARYTFYLGQTLNCLKRYEESTSYYEQRIEKGSKYGYDEVYYSYYQIGGNYESLKQYDLAEEYHLKAWEYDKQRNESLCALASMHRKNEEYQKAYDVAMLGINNKLDSYKLFTEPKCYSYKLQFELSIVCYYIKRLDEGQKAIEFLIENRHLLYRSEWKLVKGNSKFYL